MRAIFFWICLFAITLISAQKFKTNSTYIKFYSDAPMEDIEAINEASVSLIDLSKKTIAIVIPIASFVFDKSLMQEHFNENYLESDKYPNAVFKGTINGWNGENGSKNAEAAGMLEIHGITNQVTIPGKIEFNGDKLTLSTVFTIKLEDYKIKIPKAVFYNIAEEVEVTVTLEYTPYEKN